MPKIRKNVRRKTYQFNKNRKRMNKSRNAIQKVPCKLLEEKWNKAITTAKNMKSMGLVYNVNTANKVIRNEPRVGETSKTRHPEVAESLENDANAPRVSKYRIPKNQVECLIEMLDKYGEDYKKMAQDKKNYGQLTWKQYRKKIMEFKNIPEQYEIFLRHRQDKEIVPDATPIPIDEDDLF